MKVVVVNSIGPMASTVVGAVVEHFGYLNVPVRKIGLHGYLSGKYSLRDRFLKDRIIQNLREHSKMIHIGGVSVKDRDLSPPRQLTDSILFEGKIETFYRSQVTSIAELYANGRNFYAKALCYKISMHDPSKHIEYTTDIQNYDAKKIFDHYKKEFEEVFMINLHRDFIGWLDSLVSQRFAHPILRTRLMFAFTGADSLYKKYEKVISEMPGLHLNFNDLFIPNERSLICKIAVFLKESDNEINWENKSFDLFGKITDYKKTFTKNDLTPKYLSSLTIFMASRFHAGKPGFTANVLFQLCYLFDLVRFMVFSKK